MDACFGSFYVSFVWALLCASYSCDRRRFRSGRHLGVYSSRGLAFLVLPRVLPFACFHGLHLFERCAEFRFGSPYLRFCGDALRLRFRF